MNKTDLSGTSKGYKIFSLVVLILLTVFFLFPLYWIVTGSFKDVIEINARQPIWFPQNPTVDNYLGCLSIRRCCGCSTLCSFPPRL